MDERTASGLQHSRNSRLSPAGRQACTEDQASCQAQLLLNRSSSLLYQHSSELEPPGSQAQCTARACDEGTVHPPEPKGIVSIEHRDLQQAGPSKSAVRAWLGRAEPGFRAGRGRRTPKRTAQQAGWEACLREGPGRHRGGQAGLRLPTCLVRNDQPASTTPPCSTHLADPDVARPAEFNAIVAALCEVRPQQRVPAECPRSRQTRSSGGRAEAAQRRRAAGDWLCGQTSVPVLAQMAHAAICGAFNSRKLNGELLHSRVLNGWVEPVHISHPAGPHCTARQGADWAAVLGNHKRLSSDSEGRQMQARHGEQGVWAHTCKGSRNKQQQRAALIAEQSRPKQGIWRTWAGADLGREEAGRAPPSHHQWRLPCSSTLAEPADCRVSQLQVVVAIVSHLPRHSRSGPPANGTRPTAKMHCKL